MASCAMQAMRRLHCASCCRADKNTARLIAIARSEFEELLGAHHHMAAMIYRRFDALMSQVARQQCSVGTDADQSTE